MLWSLGILNQLDQPDYMGTYINPIGMEILSIEFDQLIAKKETVSSQNKEEKKENYISKIETIKVQACCTV